MAEGGTVQQALGLLGGGWGRGKCVMHTEDTVYSKPCGCSGMAGGEANV